MTNPESTPPLEMLVQFSAGELRFTVNRLMNQGVPAVFQTEDEAEADPLAARLFAIDGVRLVRFDPSRVSLACRPGEDLEEVAARAELVLRHVLGP